NVAEPHRDAHRGTRGDVRHAEFPRADGRRARLRRSEVSLELARLIFFNPEDPEVTETGKVVALRSLRSLCLKMILDFSALRPRDIYAWMISTIMPRPIAWVSTISIEGKTNLAPF